MLLVYLLSILSIAKASDKGKTVKALTMRARWSAMYNTGRLYRLLPQLVDHACCSSSIPYKVYLATESKAFLLFKGGLPKIVNSAILRVTSLVQLEANIKLSLDIHAY